MTLRPRTRFLWTLIALSVLDGCAASEGTSSSGENTTAAAQPEGTTPRRRRRRRRVAAVDPSAGSAAAPGSDPTTSSAAAPGGTGSSTETASTSPSSGSGSSSTTGTTTSALPGSTNPAGGTASEPVTASITNRVATADPARSIGAPLVSATAQAEARPRWAQEEGRAPRIVCDGAPSRPAVVSPQCPMEPENAAIVRAFVPVESRVLACNPPADGSGRLPLRARFSGAGAPTDIFFGVRVSEDTALCLGRALCTMRMPTFRSMDAMVSYEYVVMLPGHGNDDDSSGNE